MKKTIFILLLLMISCEAFSQSTQISSPLSNVDQDFDVIEYAPFIEFKSLTKAINAYNDIRFVWKKKSEQSVFYFHLKELKVDSVFYNEKKVTAEKKQLAEFDMDYYAVNKLIDDNSDSVTLRVYYSGNMISEAGVSPWGGVHIHNSLMYAMGVGFKNKYVSCTQHWLPCYDHPQDKATFKATFKIPKHLKVLSNGIQSIDTSNSEHDIYSYSMSTPAATYLLTFALGELVEKNFEAKSLNFPIRVYTMPKDTKYVDFAMGKVPQMVESFEKYFGAYPYNSLAYVASYLGSMEHQTIINLAESVLSQAYNSKKQENTTAAHELAHQWFGDLVSCSNFNDVWLSESFATFCESLWLENYENFDRYITNQNAFVSEYLSSTYKNDGIIPLDDFLRGGKVSNYPRTIYIKGAIVLGMLRYELGDELFFKAMKKYIDTHKFANARTEDFIAIMEEVSGKNLTSFFQQWVYQRGWCKIEILSDTKPLNDKFISTISINQDADTLFSGYTNLHLPLTIQLENGSKIDTILTINSNQNTFEIESEATISKISIAQKYLASLVQISKTLITSINESNESDDFNIFPNPASNFLEIRYPDIDEYALELYNLKGEKLKEHQSKGSQFSKISLVELSSGMYLIEIRKKGFHLSKMISIVK